MNNKTIKAHLYFDASPKLSAFENIIARASDSGAKSLMILAGDANQVDMSAFNDTVRRILIPIFGGIFPAIIHQKKVCEQGWLVIGFEKELEVNVIQQLSGDDQDFIGHLDKFYKAGAFDSTILTIVDGASQRISELIQDMYEVFGQRHSFLGGGSGSAIANQQPCVISNNGCLSDAAVLVDFPGLLSVAINHGWEPFAGPFLVTSANRNVVETIDFQPAFAVYKETIEQLEPVTFDENNFLELSRCYPLGLTRLGGDYLVREALSHQDGNITFFGEFPENQEFYFLKADSEKLIAAARQCGSDASLISEKVGLTIIFDCVGRWFYLGEEFDQELAALTDSFDNSTIHIGALCIGEIAGNGNSALEFHNKTTVIAATEFDGVLT